MSDQPAPEGRTPAPRTAADCQHNTIHRKVGRGEDSGIVVDAWECVDCGCFLVERVEAEAAAGVRVAEPPANMEEQQRAAQDSLRDFMDAERDRLLNIPEHMAAQPQPESGSAGRSGALRKALERLLDHHDNTCRVFGGPGSECIVRDDARDVLKALAAPAEPQP